MMIKNQNKIKANWKNKFILLFLIIILVFTAVNLAGNWQKNRQVNQEITGLEQEIGELEKNNLELKELIQYFNSTAYIEEKARLDLGLKKEGEKVVIASGQTSQVGWPSDPSPQAEATKTTLSNLEKWWQYFFN